MEVWQVLQSVQTANDSKHPNFGRTFDKAAFLRHVANMTDEDFNTFCTYIGNLQHYHDTTAGLIVMDRDDKEQFTLTPIK